MRALALVEAPDHVCCRYRILAFAPALDTAGWSLTVEGLASNPITRLAQFAGSSRFDAVILQRKLLSPWDFCTLRRCAKRLIFDFDDAVLYRDSNDPRGPHCKRRQVRFKLTVRRSDAVIAGNQFLARTARDSGARTDRVHVIPTCIDISRYTVSGHATHGPLRLTWIGSSSTLQGLERQQELWDRIAQEIPEVSLRVIADRFPDLGALPIVPIPWSLETEAEALAIGDVGVSWIPDGLWSRGKCGLKVLQYQAAGLPVIANPVGVHREMIVPGVSGLLAEDPESWAKAVNLLNQNAELRSLMGRAGRESVEKRYSVQVRSLDFVSAITGTRTVIRHQQPGSQESLDAA